MSKHDAKSPERVSCAVCLKEVPRSEALMAEAVDYVAYFCGLDCLERWQRQSPDLKRAEPPPHA